MKTRARSGRAEAGRAGASGDSGAASSGWRRGNDALVDAVFRGTEGTVARGEPITVHNLRFLDTGTGA